MCAEKCPLVSIGGRVEGLVCADQGARTPIGASRFELIFSETSVKILGGHHPTMEGPMYFFEKNLAKKTDQDLVFESWSENKKVYFWVLDHFPMTNQIHRSQERPLRLQEDSLETLTRNSVNMRLGA
jgi:hypothetical protein